MEFAGEMSMPEKASGCSALVQKISQSPVAERPPAPQADRGFVGVSILLFAASVAATIYLCESMSAAMPMSDGWAMSMAWMRMPGQTWTGAAAAFLGMWFAMMLAMMLPSLVPALSIYRRSLHASAETPLARLTILAGSGYFFVWAVAGAIVYPVGVLVVAAEMASPALARLAPLASGVAILLAGAVQLTSWKARLLVECREAPCGRSLPASSRKAWRHGIRLGLRCVLCCAGLMTILIVVGVMDLAAMAIVASAITVERLVPKPERAARIAGILAVAAGAIVIVWSTAA
ncbi:MAG TPA: DUF2182 domain-containing protein [Thermoanaerobaculia bacterium]